MKVWLLRHIYECLETEIVLQRWSRHTIGETGHRAYVYYIGGVGGIYHEPKEYNTDINQNVVIFFLKKSYPQLDR